MKAQELRIGNLVKNLYTGNNIEVDAFIISEFDLHLQPIPLSEEWLIKFGFQKTIGSQTTYYRKEGFNFLVHAENNHSIEMTWSLSYNNEYDNGYIHFVHQLQNLYFALTGEELSIL